MNKDIYQDNKEQVSPKQGKVYWHDGFYAALQLELRDYKDSLIFEDEHQLSKEALIMDVLIIKKTADVKITKNIGRIFKSRNIFEYKSEDDSLSIWDYIKVTGYAMIYSAFEEVPIQDITISFVVTPKPRKLLDYLTNDRCFEIEEVSPGIFYVKGDTFAVQIIESKKLASDENVFLKNLRSALTKRNLQEVIDACEKYGSLEKVNAYLNRIIDANKLIAEEVFDVSEETINFILECFEKNGTLERVRTVAAEKAKRDTALEMLRRGFKADEISDIVKMPLEWVQGLVLTLYD